MDEEIESAVAGGRPGRDWALATSLGALVFVPLVAILVATAANRDEAPPDAEARPAAEASTVPYDTVQWRTIARAEAMRATSSTGLQPGDAAWIVLIDTFGPDDWATADGIRAVYHTPADPVTVANPLVYPELLEERYAVVAGPYRARSDAERMQRRLREEMGVPSAFPLRVTLRMPD